MSYLKDAAGRTVRTPQSEPMRGDQVENSAGGFVWTVDSFMRLRRWLVLGSEGGSYYISERDLTKESVATIAECLAADYTRTVDLIVEVSVEGRAPKNDPAIFALAFVASNGSDEAKRYALDRLSNVCRIGTHLFMFCEFVDTMSGWGRAKRRAVGAWYTEKDPGKLAYQLVKYRQRGGWTHRDVLRLAHPKSEDGRINSLLDWAAHGEKAESAFVEPIIAGFVRAQAAQKPETSAALIREYGLPREAVNTDHLKTPEVWEALLEQNMPITALIRNLANMSRIGVLTPTSAWTKTVAEQITDAEKLKKGRVHPLNLLFALKTYASGRSFRGSNEWSPVPKIVDALNDAFYLAFGAVEPTGKRTLFALDVSGSMSATIGDTSLSAREGATAMALVTAAVEDLYECVAFASGGTFNTGRSRYGRGGDGLVPVALSGRERLDDAIAKTREMPFGGTDCSLPMIYAIVMEREIDTFLIYTDSETWAGDIHPMQALGEYRKKSGIPARLVVVGMTSNGFTIADPNDPGCLDVVGFDTSTPNVISDFARGLI